jgi:hypothetical protein
MSALLGSTSGLAPNPGVTSYGLRLTYAGPKVSFEDSKPVCGLLGNGQRPESTVRDTCAGRRVRGRLILSLGALLPCLKTLQELYSPFLHGRTVAQPLIASFINAIRTPSPRFSIAGNDEMP